MVEQFPFHGYADPDGPFRALADLLPGTAPSGRVRTLLSGASWLAGEDEAGTPVSLTFSFMTAAPPAEASSGFQAMTPAQQAATRLALAQWAEVAGITFTETTGPAHLEFGTASRAGNGGWAYYPGDAAVSGNVFFNNQMAGNDALSPGEAGFRRLIHESGHALGLKHPGNYNAVGDPTPGPYLPTREDTHQYTVMSYTLHPTADVLPATPQLYDIAAMQALYGANRATRAGDDVYRLPVLQEVVRTIWDGGGFDVVDASGQTVGAVIDLHAGSFSSIGSRADGSAARNNIAVAYGVTIEGALGGAGDDELTGNEADNRLDGGAGADTLSGGPGDDLFLFAPSDAAATDLILDLAPGDRVRIEGVNYSAGALGDGAGDAVPAAGIRIGAAGDGMTRLFFDTDGVGGGADLTVALAGRVEAGDFLVQGGDLLRSVPPPPPSSPPPSPPPPPPSPAGGDEEAARPPSGPADGGNRIVLPAGGGRLLAGGGSDTVDGSAAADSVAAGAGDDLVAAGEGADMVYGNQGADLVYGNQGADTQFGGQGGDHLFGGRDDDAVYGNLGRDTLFGGRGGDRLFGGRDADDVRGGPGDDLLSGGLGDDTLGGGEGADRFVFAPGGGGDLVADFDPAGGDLLVAGGRSWTVREGEEGAVLEFASGDRVTLAGIRADQVSSAWFAAG